MKEVANTGNFIIIKEQTKMQTKTKLLSDDQSQNSNLNSRATNPTEGFWIIT